ncbi:MAG: S8 family serine peptidase [Lysobacterales bacterium]
MHRLFAIALLCLCSPSRAETWLRVEQASAALRADLPAGAVDYGGFVWMPAVARPDAELGARVSRSANPFHLVIDGQAIDPLTLPAASTDPWWQDLPSAAADFHLLQLNGPPRSEDLQALRAAGIRPVRYLAPFSYIVWADQAQLDGMSARSTLARWSGPLLPAQRVPPQSRDLGPGLTPSMALIDADSADNVLAALSELGASLVKRTPLTPDLTLVQLTLSGEQYLAAAHVPGVYTLQHIAAGAGPRGEISNQSIVGGYNGNPGIYPGYLDWLSASGVTGLGVKVSVVDGGFRSSHQDLLGNVAPCQGTAGSCTSLNDNHGTHVAGAIVGTGFSNVLDGGGFLRGLGVAPGAKVIQHRYAPFLAAGPGSMVADGMINLYRDVATSGAQLANNSWGPTGTPQGYDIPTMQVDMITRDANASMPGNQQLLAVWSIMNGNGERNTGLCAPSSLGSPDEAKNLLSVGSTQLLSASAGQIDALFDLSINSAHGPACDGRRVPNLVAPGCYTDSTNGSSNSAYTLMCGTSMASPMVSGAAALYFEQYRKLHGLDPSPALVKAAFTAAATNLTGHLDADARAMPQRPNRFAGWGRLDLDAVINPGVAVWLLDQTEVLSDSGAAWNAYLRPADPDQPVRIMLAWSDAAGPGLGGTTPSWTNDLDLQVRLGEDTYLGNVFDEGGGYSIPGGVADDRNNLEGVFLAPAVHGGNDFRVRVLAAVIAADALNPWEPATPQQDFALICYNCEPGTPPEIFADGFEEGLPPARGD